MASEHLGKETSPPLLYEQLHPRHDGVFPERTVNVQPAIISLVSYCTSASCLAPSVCCRIGISLPDPIVVHYHSEDILA